MLAQMILSNNSTSLVSTHSINADTGTTGNFIAHSDADVLLNIRPAINGISVALPNGDIITSTHTATLNLPSLPLSARAAHVFPGLTGSLLSIGLLSTADAVTILDTNGSLILTGQRSATTRLWMIDLPTQQTICPSSELSLYASAVIHHENDSQ